MSICVADALPKSSWSSLGVPVMSAEIEFRHLVAAVTLAEEMNFTRAAKRLRLSQPAISRRLAELENRSRLRLVNRDHANFAMTDAGRAFVEEAKLSLVHYQRALQYAKAATEGIESHLSIGHSPYLDPVIISTLFGNPPSTPSEASAPPAKRLCPRSRPRPAHIEARPRSHC
jgi:predicted transcriptional regulator